MKLPKIFYHYFEETKIEDILNKYDFIFVFTFASYCNYCKEFDLKLSEYLSDWNLMTDYKIVVLYVLADDIDTTLLNNMLFEKESDYISVDVFDNKLYMDDMNINQVPHLILLKRGGYLLDRSPIETLKLYGVKSLEEWNKNK